MNDDLSLYDARLQEIQAQLSDLLPSIDGDRHARFRITVAVSFIEHARQALTEPLRSTEVSDNGRPRQEGKRRNKQERIISGDSECR